MTHSFYATLSAHIDMDDSDFERLKEKASRHYDSTVKSSVEVGGFLYGLTNRGEFSNGENKTLELSGRELQLCIKALEFDNSDHTKAISKRLIGVLNEMYFQQEQINKAFQ